MCIRDRYYTSIDRWVTNILEDNPEIQSYVDSALGKIYDFINNWITTTFLQDVQKLLTTLTSSVVAFVKGFMNFLIGFVASIYILWSKETFQAQSKKIIVALLSPKGADHVFYLGRNIYRVFNGFVIGKIVDSAIIGVLCYIGIPVSYTHLLTAKSYAPAYLTVGVDAHIDPLGSCEFAKDSRKNSTFCRADRVVCPYRDTWRLKPRRRGRRLCRPSGKF